MSSTASMWSVERLVGEEPWRSDASGAGGDSEEKVE